MAVNLKVCLLGWGVQVGMAASISARTRAAALRQRLVGQAPVGGEDPLLDPAQRLGVGLRLLPDDRLQLLHPPAHGDQGVQHPPVEVAPTTLGGPPPAKASSSKRRMTWSRGLPLPRS